MRKPPESRSTPAPLDADAAFVVHLTGGDPSTVSGRAEHVTSGRSRRFASLNELYEFMQSVLAHRGAVRTQSR